MKKNSGVKKRLNALCLMIAVALPYAGYGQSPEIKLEGNTRTVSLSSLSEVRGVKVGKEFSYTASGLSKSDLLTLELGFVEPENKAPGERVFNVIINDKAALSNFDIATQTRNSDGVVVKRFTITPREGFLEFQFVGVKGEAALAFIRLKGPSLDYLVNHEHSDSKPSPVPVPDKKIPEPAALQTPVSTSTVTEKISPAIPLLTPDKKDNETFADYDPQTMTITVDKEHKGWKSGMPIGGIGTGKFEILPSGEFANFTINNSWDLPVLRPAGTFLAVATKATSRGGSGRLLQSNPTGSPFTKTPKIPVTEYKGIFPFSEWDFKDPGIYVDVKVKAWSAVVPHDHEDSNLPASVINVVLHNPNKYPVAAGVVLSWEDLNGRGGSLIAGEADKHGFVGNTVHEDIQTSGLRGIKISGGETLTGRPKTFTGEYFIGTPIKGAAISRSLNWNSQSSEISWWKKFSSSLRLDKFPAAPEVSKSASKQPASSALCVTVNLAPKERRQIPFVVSWYMPTITNIETKSNPTVPVAPNYTERFKSSVEVASYFAKHRLNLEKSTREWHDLVMRSNLPSWVRVHSLNSLAPLISNSVVLTNQRFSLLESIPDMHGMLGGIDTRWGANDFLISMFPRFFEKELELYAKTQKDDGQIARYVGNVHGALAGLDEKLLGEGWPDATSAFLYESHRLRTATGNDNFLTQNKPVIDKAKKWLKEQITSAESDKLPSVFSEIYGWKGAALSTYGNAIAAMTLAGEDLPGEQQTWKNRLVENSESLFGNVLSGMSALRNAGYESIISDEETKKVFDNIWDKHYVTHNPVPSVSDGDESPALSILNSLQAGYGAAAIQAGIVDKGIEVYMRMFKVAYAATYSPWRPSFIYSVPLASEFAYRSHPSGMAAWSIYGALSGVYLDLDNKILSLNPQVPGGLKNNELKIPVFTTAFWGWLEYNSESSTGTLSIVKVMPGFRDQSVEVVATHLDSSGPKVKLNSPFTFEVGKTLKISGWPDKPGATVNVENDLSTDDAITTKSMMEDAETSGQLIESPDGKVDRQGEEI